MEVSSGNAAHDMDGEESGQDVSDDETDVAQQVDLFFNELDLELAQRKKALKSLSKAGGSKGVRMGALPHHLKAVMGQANLRVAMGDLDEAIQICKEVIRQAPDVPEPYLTLEMIYDEMGDTEKRFQFALIAAHLQPRDTDQWMKTAGLAVEIGELKKAITCYSKVLQVTPRNLDVLWRRAGLLVEVGEYGKAVEIYHKYMEHLPPRGAGQRYLQAAMEIAKSYNDMDQIGKAIDVLRSAFSKYPQHADEPAVNMLAELYLITKEYWNALETILDFYQVSIPANVMERARSGEGVCQAFVDTVQAMQPVQEGRASLQQQQQQQRQQSQQAEQQDGSGDEERGWRKDGQQADEWMEIQHEGDTLQQTLAQQQIDQQQQPQQENQQESSSLHWSSQPFGATSPKRDHHLKSSSSSGFNITTALHLSMGILGSSPTHAPQPSVEVGDPVVAFIEDLTIPAQAPLDLKAKVAICLIHLYLSAPKSLLAAIYEDNPEYCGDIFLDVAEAFMDVGLHSRAQPLLSILVETQNYGQPGVWLKHANCLYSLGDLEGAAMSYGHVVAMAPHHTDAKLNLASIYAQLGRTDDALLLLGGEEADEEDHSIEESNAFPRQPKLLDVDHLSPTIQNLKVAYHRSGILLSESMLGDFADLTIDMLDFLFRDVVYLKDARSFVHVSAKMKKKKIADLESYDSETKQVLNEKEKMLTLDEWWDVFAKACQVLHTLERKADLMSIVFAAHASMKFVALPKEKQLDLMGIGISSTVLCGDWREAMAFMKRFISSEATKPGVSSSLAIWSLFNLNPLFNVNTHRVFLRLLAKDPSSVPLLSLVANHYFSAGSTRTALNLYHQVSKLDPSNYLCYFCVGLVFVSLLQQRKPTQNMSRGALLMQALGCFMQYLKMRGKCQESLYNVARVFHQVGQVHHAANLYKLVLTTPSEVDDPSADLKKEAAYNLSLIYKSSGNTALARHIMWTYCAI